jgi:octaprenyl-diphosphate synthase
MAVKQPILEEEGNISRDVTELMIEQLRDQPKILQNAVMPYLIVPGKMVRSRLFFTAAAACGSAMPPLELAAAFEFLHLATLIHDDLIDNSKFRRGEVTIHNKWNQSTAVLSGDFCFGQSLRLASICGGVYLSIISGLVSDLVYGEFVQKQQQFQLGRSETEYWDCIYHKTAKFFEQICHASVLVARAEQELSDDLREFGKSLGLAYQIKNDLEDLLPERAEPFQDVQDGIFNLPIIHSLSHAADPRELKVILKSKQYSELLPYLAQNGSIHYTVDVFTGLINTALRCLTKLPKGPHRDSLKKLTFQVANLNKLEILTDDLEHRMTIDEKSY